MFICIIIRNIYNYFKKQLSLGENQQSLESLFLGEQKHFYLQENVCLFFYSPLKSRPTVAFMSSGLFYIGLLIVYILNRCHPYRNWNIYKRIGFIY